MSKFVKAEMDGSLKINIQTGLFEKVKRSQTWFQRRSVGGFIMFGLAASDIAGFSQIANKTMSDSPTVRALIIVSFTAAFELAPLYLGYAWSLKCYDLGKKIHDKIIVLSLSAFLIGIIANAIYRFMTMNIAYAWQNADGIIEVNKVALPATVLLTIMPISTSIVNIVIGCLVFDPLYFDLIRLKKRLSVLQEKKRQLNVYIAEINEDDKLVETTRDEMEREYKNAKKELNKAKKRLEKYAEVINMI